VKTAIDTAGQNLLVRLLVDGALHPRVKVVVLAGAGAAFCTGADVRSMGAPDPDDAIAQAYAQTEAWQAHEARVDRLRRLAEASFLLHDMGKPTIAKLRGPAAGLGFSLALACDFRLAADNAFFVSSFAKIGTPGDYGGSYFLTRLVGPSKAKEIYMLSDRVGAAEALALGMVNRVVADPELDAATDAFALRLANGPALAYRAIKENVHAAAHQTLQQVLDLEASNMIRCRLSEDCKEALAAFQQKREPRFEGR
jgi:2-(1,2-epoxy-1,2-dihydrophenyl)acetyl-CoA isomerase